MKNNFLKNMAYLTPALLTLLLIQTPTQLLCTEPATVVGAVATQRATATDMIKKLFDKNYRKGNYSTIGDLLKQLAIFDHSFSEFPANAKIKSSELFEAIQAHIELFTADLQGFFRNLSFAEFDIVIREKLAMEEFYSLLTCPISKVPKWSQCVDQMDKLLRGNALYKKLREDLISVRNKSGWFGKLAIARALYNHIELLPAKLKNTINGMSNTDLGNRIIG